MQMADRSKKRYLTSLIISEIQIKTTMRCHFTHARMALIKKTKVNRRRWRKENSCVLLMEM